ncbi:MAG: HEAT repeat domain-containing protein [Alphaproteobacteria bacterium]|nr:HEAT repeat domain-containing protein [Alphaproteobacteria bacterium]
MPRKTDPTRQQLAALAAIDDPSTPEARALVRKALRGRSGHVAASAAELLAQEGLADAVPELLAALERFYTDPVKRDPGCVAKLAILTALDRLDLPDPAPFLAASTYQQLEPAWGPPEDTAVSLRARAALALGRVFTDEALVALGAALGDPAPHVRSAAAEALQERGGGAAAALLALRVRLGDEDPVARGDCMGALVRLSPERGVAMLAPLLRDPDIGERELAALSLGESRQPEALAALVAWLDRVVLETERALAIAAIGAHRSEAAQRVLLELVEDGSLRDVERAARALARQGATLDQVRGVVVRDADRVGIVEEAFADQR